MRFLLWPVLILLSACASVVRISADTAESSFPITCVRSLVFNETTGRRDALMQFNDNINGLEVVVHVDQFIDIDETRVTIVYHTFPATPDLVCVLHASPNSESVILPLEGLI